MRDDHGLESLLDRPLPRGFRRRVVVIEPGGTLAYDEADWAGAIVTVECGRLELESTAGVRVRFEPGAVLWLTNLPLRALYGVGADPTVLVAISRELPHKES